ncbi:MAG: hypothetical protein PHU75_06970 [Candidatus Nanopelagicales bacterium]|nr:hypothetical protein [Candidatus Nanopelagicales bacterium]
MQLPPLRMTSGVRWVLGVVGALLLLLAVGVAVGGFSTDAEPAAIPVGGESTSTPTPTATSSDPLPTALDPAVSAIRQGDVRATSFEAGPDLPNTPSVATGYRVTPGRITPEQFARAVAQQFGVLGAPVEADDGAFTVGGTRGSDPQVTVFDDPLVRWQYTDPTLAPGKPVDADQARRIATTLLSPLGVPVDELEWQVGADQNRVVVQGWLVLKGLRTELGWTVVVDPEGEVVWADGFAGSLAPVPGYPLMGAADALARALRPGWEFAGPTAWTGSGSAPELAVPGPVPTVKGRPVLVAGVGVLTVTKAEVGLAQFWQPDGSLLILPSYIVTTDDDRSWTLLGVGNAYVTVRPLVPAGEQPNPAAAGR